MSMICFFLLAVVGTGSSNKIEKPLKDVYARDFQIGVALNGRYCDQPYSENRKELELVRREFNSVTSENFMKPEFLRPAPGKFDFERSDEFVKLAKRLDLDVVGHVLVWHSQTPGWFFENEEGNPVSREALIERMREHIHTVITRYKGHVKCWDVVNEAVDTRRIIDPENPIAPDGSTNMISEAFFRPSEWFNIIGEEYIELAFKFANEADPKAILIYNDYGMTDQAKAAFVVQNIVRPLKRKGIRIEGVGMQGHWHVDRPETEQIGEAVKRFAAAGVKVHITELDLDILPVAYGYEGADISTQFELQEELNPYKDGAPEEMLQMQAVRYREIFNLFQEHRHDIARVTFWGISDRDSWRNNFPVRGRTAYPLLFDRSFEPKPAYHALTDKKWGE